MKVAYIGSLTLSSTFTLHKVLYIPTFKYNLISVYRLIQQFNSIVLFTSSYLIKDLSRKKLLVLGRLDQGLYKLYHFPSNSALNNVIQISTSALNNAVKSLDNVPSSALNIVVSSVNVFPIPSLTETVQQVNDTMFSSSASLNKLDVL